MNIKEISVQTLKKHMDHKARFVLLDVRESYELEKAHISPNVHMPMNLIPNKMSELQKDIPIYVICHTGTRSWYVTRFLQEAGFNVSNIKGGIHAWSLEIDPSTPTY